MNVTFQESILYYDCEQLFEAADAAGGRYVAVHTGDYATGCEYLMAPASPARLAAFRNGKIDLRQLLLDSPTQVWYTAAMDVNDADSAIALTQMDTPIADCDNLPVAGFYVGVGDSGGIVPAGVPPAASANPALPNPDAPRLIEQWLPINEVSIEAVREGGALAGHPPVNQLHVWWARRPLIASRAAVAASMLPTDADRSRFLANIGTTTGVVAARRQMDAIKAEGGWSDISFPNQRAFLHNPDFLSDDTAAPVILDVTAGGGSIPFEAGRLGFRAIANELNPVACFILRATCRWPQQYGYPLLDDYRECAAVFQARVSELLDGVYPDEPAPDCSAGKCPHPQRYRCAAGCDAPATCSHRRVGSREHETVRAQRYAQTYLWARTVSCPGCRRVIPLSPNWRLDNKGTGMLVEPDRDPIGLRIVHDRQACSDCRGKDRGCHLAGLYPNRRVSGGTVTRAIATCPSCGSTTPKGYLAQEAQAARMGHRLYCVIYRDSWRDRKKDGSLRKRETTCRVFAAPAERHAASDTHVASELAQRLPQWDAEDVLPTEELPDGNKTKDAIYYGMPEWRDMFNPRQQLAHGYCVQAFRECVDADAAAGRLDDCRKAAWGYAAIALDKMINRNSLLTRWDGGTSKVAGTFDSHDFGFKWSYSEMAITCRGLGLEWSLNDIADCLSEMLDMTGYVATVDHFIPDAAAAQTAPPAKIIQGDARDLPLDDGSVDCVVFDPPYEENVCYAELSDFFYVWLKRTAGYVFPDDFTDYLTEKDQEAIASPARFRSRDIKGRSAKTLALQDYQEKMADIFKECRRVVKPAGIMTVMFNHKSTAAWDALTIALITAGFAITRTWPVKTEAESSMHIKGKAAARTTILLVCRPRGENAFPSPWHEVEERIAQAVQEDIRDNLSQADLRPIDLYLSAFGPALRVISEHWGTERESANAERPQAPFVVTPTDALQVARREVSRHRAREISREWADNAGDAGTKFYILAKDASENDTLLFDEANLLARAIGVPLEKSDAALRRIVAFQSDKVALLSARDRLAARSIGEDITPGATLDTVHTAIALTDRRNTLDAQQWLTQHLHNPHDNQFRATLEALLRTTKPGHDDHQAQRNLWQALYGEEPPLPAAVQGTLL